MKAESSQIAAAPVRKKRKIQAIGNATAGPSTNSTEKSKVPGVRGRRKTGLLASLPSMPLDILFEILGHLKPYDILRLARTTKDFRKLLLNKSSLSVWKAALRNVPDLPDRPSGMSEPAWTSLVFSPHCNFCLTTSIRKVQWIFRVRICSKCAKEHLAESRFALYGYEGACIEFLIPTYPGKKGTKIYFKSDYKVVQAQYAALEGEARQLFVEERKKVVTDIAKHAKLCETWARSQIFGRDQELQQLRADRLVAITKKLEELGWAEDIAGISMPDSLANHKLVDRPQLLTERIWTNIKPSVLEFMTEMREKRFKREFAALVNRRKRSALTVLRTFKNARLPETDIMPQGPDFCHFSAVSEVLNRPTDVEVDASSFDDIVPLLPELITEWRASIKEKMTQVVKMRDGIPRSRAHRLDFILNMRCPDEDEDEDEAPPVHSNSHLTDEEFSRKLTLASTVFTCHCGGGYNDYWGLYDSDDEDSYSPSKILLYPQVMGHSCQTRVSKMFPWELSSTSDPSCRLESWSCRSERKQWNSSGLSLHPSASRIARHIIQLAGLDPDLATSHQMDRLEIRFGCSACSESDSDDDDVYPIFNWRGAISHIINKHAIRNISSILVKISEDDFTEDIKEAETKHWALLDFIWSCVHCRDLPTEIKANTLHGIKDHISRRHQIESPMLNQDYFQDFAAPDLRSYLSLFYVRYNQGRFSVLPENSPLLLNIEQTK